jgi:hypothetical protein
MDKRKEGRCGWREGMEDVRTDRRMEGTRK